jgi:hypothetical protein
MSSHLCAVLGTPRQQVKLSMSLRCKMTVMVSWVVTSCKSPYLEDGGNKLLHNIDLYLPDYTLVS